MRLRSARRRRLLVVLTCLWLAGCGGGFPSGLPTGFINQTQHSDTELWAIWKTAQQEVAHKPDVASSVLFAATGVGRSDPTGMIACPQPCNVRFAAAYSLYPRQVTKYAASWEFQGDNFSSILKYEFENQILAELGYSLRWR